MALTGFDIMEEGSLDDFKSIYDIFDGISQVWDDLTETQQSRVSEILGGTRQLQVISSIINNWDDAASAYAEAMDSAGVATQAQATWMTSLQAKTQQFNATVQELYYDFLSSDVAGGVVEFGTQIIAVIDNMIDSIGSIGTAIIGLGVGSGLQGLISAFMKLEENGGSLEAGLNRIGLAFANFGKTFQSAFAGVGTGLTSGGGILSALGQGLEAFWVSLGPVGQALAVIAGVTAAITALNNAIQEQHQNAVDSASAWSESNDSVEGYKTRIQELDEALASGTLSEQEAYEAKVELSGIQDSLVEMYGSEAEALDIVNGKYEEQISLIDQLSATRAREELNENAQQIDTAEMMMESNMDRILGAVWKKQNREMINDIIEPYSDLFEWHGTNLLFKGSAAEAEDALAALKDGIADLQNKTKDETLFSGLYDGVVDALADADEIIADWGTIYDTSLQERVIADTEFYGEELTENGEGKVAAEWLQDYYNTIDEYNQALKDGDQDRILETEDAYKHASADIHSLLDDEESGFSDFARQVAQIENHLDSEAASAQHFREVAAGGTTIEDDVDQQIRTVVDKIKAAGYDEIELKTRIIETSGLEETTSVFAQLMALADQFDLSMDDIVGILVEVGAVAASTSDEVANATEKTLWSVFADEEVDLGGQIDEIQSKISSLNGTLDDVRNGESIDWADLVPEYQVSGNAETLEQELTEYGLNAVRDFVEGYNSALDGIEDPEQLQQSAAMLRSIIESLDLSSIDFSDFETVGELIQSFITDAEGKTVVGGLLQDYFGNEEAYEIMLRIALDPSSSQKSRHEWESEIKEWQTDAEESLDGTLSGIFTDAAGNETEFASSVDKYKDDIEELNEAIAQLQNGEQVDLQQLVTDFPELSDYVDNLEEGLSQVSYDEIKDLGAQVQEEINSAMEKGMSESEAQALNDMFAEWIASADISGILPDDFWDQLLGSASETALPAIQDILDKYGENELTAEIFWKMTQLPGLSDNPEDWLEQFDEMYELCIVASVDTSAIEQLQDDLSEIQTQADDIQNEMSRNETLGIKNGEQMYRDLINNGNLQLQNLQDQKAMWEAIAAATDPLSSTYAEAQSEIANINSEINSVISSQYEWNAAADALSYEAGEALSAYNEANSSRNAGDNYKDMKSAFEAAEELYEEGLVGTDEFQAAAAMLSPNGMTDWVNWEQNYAKATRYFTDDNSGLINFLEDLSQKTNDAGEALANFDEATGTWTYNIDDIADSADQLGISMEAFQAIMGRTQDYGFTNNWFATVEDGVNRLGDLYTDLAEAEIKLQDLEKKRSEGSTSVTDEVIQAQKDEIDSIKLAIVDSTDLLSKTTDQFEEQTAAQYQALTTMLDKSMDIADERIRNTYLQNVKDWAEQNGLDVGDLFTVNKEGQIDGLVDETFEQLKKDYGKGEYELDFDVSVKTEAQELGESLSDTFEEVIEGTGKSTKDMFDEFVQTFEETDLEGALSQIIWGNGEYEEGVEDVERAIDHITSSLGLAQSDAAALGQLLAAYAETGDLEKAIELVADTSQYEEEVNYALAEPEEQEVEIEVTEPEELTRQEMTGLRLGVETGEAEGKVEQLHGEIEDMFNENIEQTVETTIETNKDIGSINDLLALDEEDLAIKCGVEMDSAELSAIEDYIGWEEPELPVTIRMEQTQFDALLESQEQNEIQITVDTDEATGEIQTLQGEIDDLISNSSTPITIEVDVSAASGALSGLQQQISEIMSGNALTVDGNGGFATEELTSYYSIPITGEIQSFEISADIETVPIDGELTTIAVDAEVQTVDVNGEMKEISVSAETPPVPLSGNLQDISVDAEVQTIPLTGEISSIDVTADTPSVPIEATISSVDQEAISSLSDRSVTVTSSTSGTEDVNALTAAIDSLYDRTVQETAKVSGTSEVQSLKSAIDSLYSKTVDVRATVAGEADVRSLANAIANVQSKTVTVTSITQNITQSSDYGILATGTAYSEGSLAKGWKEFKKVGGSYIKGAYAGGSWRDWSLHSDEDAIVNELGQESVVRDGHWMLLPGGAHVESLKRGDIVFSADQTKELLKYGKVTSGGGHGYVAHATGTAYNMMNAHANRGQFAPTVASTSSSSSTSSGNTTVIYNNSGNTTNNYGTSSGGTTSNAAEAAQTFEDWVGTLFDWVEVRLERLTDQISNYIQKAENAINTRYYNQADRSYRSAINKSLTQVGREDQAYLKYMEEVDAILQKAADSGIIDANAIGIIKTQMEKGELKIEEYSEKMQKVISATQEYYDKAMEASYAIEQLNADIISYTQSLKSLRDTQRDSKISNYEDYAVAGSTYTSTSGTYHLRYESELRLNSKTLSKENAAYSKESTQMKNDMKKYQSKAKSQVESAYSEASGKYKKALKRAQKAINKQEAVSNSDMKIIGENSNTVYAYLLAYNESLNNLEEARLEEAVVYASNSASIMENTAEKYNKLDENSQNKIDLNEMKASNSNVAKTANKYLDRAAKEYDTILSNDQAEVDEYTTEYKSNRKKIRNKKGTTAKLDKASASKQKKVQKAVDNAKKNAEKGVAIGAGTMSNLEKYYSEGYVTQSFYQSCVDYNNAIEHKREAEAQLEIDKQTAQEEQRAYGQQEFENVQNEYENKTRQNQSKTANIEAQQNYQTTRGIIMNEQNYRDLISQSQKDVKIYNDEIKALNDQIQHNIDSGYWTTTDQEYIDAMLAIEELETEVINCETAQEEWNNAIINLPFEEVERMINSLTTVQSLLESISSLTTAQRQDLTLSNYTDQIDNYYKQLEQWEADLAEAQKDYQKALADPDGVYGGKTVQTWEDEINQYQTEINNCEIAIENMKDSLRDDIIWRQFDRAHSRAKELLDVLEGISGLLDEAMWFTYEGQITEFGIAEVSSLTKQISAAQTDVQNYMNDIDTLQKLYDMNLAGIDIDEKALSELGELSDKYYNILEYGFYSDEEYTEKMAELQEQLLDAANSVQDLTNDIINMYKTAAQYELDAIFDVIDAEKDALDAKKSYVIMAPLL